MPSSTATARSSRSSSSTLLARLDREWATPFVLATGLVAGLGAASAGAAPTGHRAIDVGLTVAVALVVVAASARARRWAWLVSAGMAAVLADGAVAIICAGVAVAVAFLAGVTARRPRRWVGALIGALVVQALFRQQAVAFQGADLLWGTLAAVPVLASGYAGTGRTGRRRVRMATAAVAAVAVAAVALFGIVAAGAWGDLEDARAAADDGLDALRDGDQEASAAAFEQAAAGFASARSNLGGPLALPVRLVPVASQHAAAAEQVAVSGEAISRAALTAAEEAPYQDLRSEAGRVDVALLASMAAPVDGVALALAEAEADLIAADSTWLVPPVSDPLEEVVDEIAQTRPGADLAAEAVRVAPGLLGADGPRRYLLAFGTPAETRFLGGFVGGYGILTADDGELTLEQSGRVDDLVAPTEPVDLDWSDELDARYARWFPGRFLQNVTVTPDLPTDAGLARQMAPAYGLGEIDGMVYVDPHGLAALLELTGPVDVDRLEAPVTADTVADLLLRRQYLELGSNDARSDLLTDVADATFDALTSRDLPGPRQLGEALGPAVAAGHLRFVTFDQDEDELLDRLGVRGAFPPAFGTDLVSVRMANDGGNKLDAYLEREVRYEAVVDPASRATRVAVEVTIRNTAPGDLPLYVAGNVDLRNGRPGAPPPGDAQVFLSAYTASEPVGVTVDGDEVPVELRSEGRLHTASVPVVVPRGGEVRVRFESVGEVAPDGAFRITWVPQPLAQADELHVAVRADGDGSVVVAGDGLEQSGDAATWSGAAPEVRRFEGVVAERSP